MAQASNGCCRECAKEDKACEEFVQNIFKKYRCKACFHDSSCHDGLTDEQQAHAALARDDSKPSTIIPDFLYMGSMKGAMNVKELQAIGVTHIVNCARDLSKVWPKFKTFPDLFTYHQLDLLDSKSQDIADVLEPSVKFIQEVKDSGTGKVFVHCAQGVSRSGAVVVAYLMRTQGLSYDEALAFARKGRVVCQPNPHFEKQLREFNKS